MKSTKKLTTEEFIKRAKDAHGDEYDYSKSEYKNSTTKVTIICPKHGEFYQKPLDHTRGVGCVKCGYYKNTRLKTTEQFIKESKKRHGALYDYSKVEYENSNSKIIVICPKHGEFTQTPHAHSCGQGCPKCGIFKNNRNKTTKEFIKNAKNVHGDKYDYSETDYTMNKKKVTIICPIHGEFSQKPNTHLCGNGCKRCGVELRGRNRSLSVDAFIENSKKIHKNKYDYSMVDYINNQTRVSIICKKHGVFDQLPNNHMSGANCPRCASYVSKSEIKIQSLLDSMGVEYIQHDRKLIKPFELDFIIPEHKIAIEFDGIYFHSEHNGGKDKKYHLNKTEMCEKSGYRLIHIFENEYLHNYELLRFKLRSLFNKNKYKIFARKCEIREIDGKTKKRFNEKYHLQGDSQSCLNLGLYYKNRLIQVMTFSKRRKALGSKHVDGEYELSRMSSIKGFNIVGGASKLLKHFERFYKPTKLISYADRRWSVGNVYYKLGFRFIRNTTPNYWYFYKKRAIKPLFHRYKFAKHTLKKQLDVFNENLTEWENMKNNSYDRIWDCGSLYFEKNYIK